MFWNYFLEGLVISHMAKQSKKILKKITAPKEEDEIIDQRVAQPERKPWERIVLIAIICLTLFLLTTGWDLLDNLNRGMYSTLLISLLLMYAQRTIDPHKIKIIGYLNKAAFVSIATSIVLFGFVVYYRYLV